MSTVLVTAFEPYGRWKTNASQICLEALQSKWPANLDVTTVVYPVDFDKVRERLPRDLDTGYDFALHLGQAAERSRIGLELLAVNVGGEPDKDAEDHAPLCEDGPVGYRSSLPLAKWAKQGRSQELPIEISHHAGTYLCNATMYWTHYFAERRGLQVQSCFVHLPLAKEQIEDDNRQQVALPATIMVSTLRWLLGQLVRQG